MNARPHSIAWRDEYVTLLDIVLRVLPSHPAACTAILAEVRRHRPDLDLLNHASPAEPHAA